MGDRIRKQAQEVPDHQAHEQENAARVAIEQTLLSLRATAAG